MTPWKRRLSKELLYGSYQTPQDFAQWGTWTPVTEGAATPRRGLLAKSILTRFRRSSGDCESPAPTPASTPETFDHLSHSLKQILGSEKGPHIKPYSFSQCQNQDFTELLSNECAICDESIHNRLALESIRFLKCGHSIHEQCLNLLVDYQHQVQNTGDVSELALHCSSCNSNIPLGNQDETLFLPGWRESMVSNTMTLEVTRESMLHHNRVGEVALVRSPLPDLSIHTTIAEIMNPDIKDLCTRFMLRKAPTMPLHLLETLGDIRMVDRLDISVNGNDYAPCSVFLFADHIVFVPDKPLAEYHVVSLTNPDIDINVSGIIVIRPGNAGSLVDEVCLASERNEVIQKWVIGVIDGTLEFPLELFSSTINLETVSIR